MEFNKKTIAILLIVVIALAVLGGSFLLSSYGVSNVYVTRAVGKKWEGRNYWEYGVHEKDFDLSASADIFAFPYVDNIRIRGTSDGPNWFLELELTAKLQIDVEVTQPASPVLLGHWEDLGPFESGRDEEYVHLFNQSYSVYAYGFKINTRMTGEIEISMNVWRSNALFPADKEKKAKELVEAFLIPKFNEYVYASGIDVWLEVDAPRTVEGAVTPGFVGIMGMWLKDYETTDLVAGTGADLSPQVIGKEFYLLKDKYDDAEPLFYATKDAYNPPLVGDDFIAYPDHFAAEYGFTKIAINHLGSMIYYNENGAFPNYWQWAHELHNGESLPAVSQIVRMDVCLFSTKAWEIPLYELEDWEPSIVVVQEPENRGNVRSPTMPSWLNWTLIIIILVVVAVIIVFAVALKKRGGK